MTFDGIVVGKFRQAQGTSRCDTTPTSPQRLWWLDWLVQVPVRGADERQSTGSCSQSRHAPLGTASISIAISVP
jgi:hypothetical protein